MHLPPVLFRVLYLGCVFFWLFLLVALQAFCGCVGHAADLRLASPLIIPSLLAVKLTTACLVRFNSNVCCIVKYCVISVGGQVVSYFGFLACFYLGYTKVGKHIILYFLGFFSQVRSVFRSRPAVICPRLSLSFRGSSLLNNYYHFFA